MKMSTSSATWLTSSWMVGSVPGVAPAAMQEGRHAAQNIDSQPCADSRDCPFAIATRECWRRSAGEPPSPRSARSRRRASFAWLLWLFVHIFFLIGFRNRLIVMIHWAWSYVTFDRGARLITEPLKEPLLESDLTGSREPQCLTRGAAN